MLKSLDVSSSFSDRRYYPAAILLLLSLLICPPVFGQDFVGSTACAGCHQAPFEQWQQSHHRHAMAEADSASVLGNFNDAVFDYFGRSSRFFMRGDEYFVETENSQGELEEFEIAYTFGLYPLQQYLIAFPDGRLQALSISWDSRPAEQGGQRWYHLYPDENITADDPLHWTGAFQNWNSRCASCHSTDLQKGYSEQDNRYETVWAEISVGCEACHGPGSAHLAWAAGDASNTDTGTETGNGLLNSIDRVWEPVAGELPIPEQVDFSMSEQLQVCAGCHSRRSELQPRDLAHSYHDDYSLSPLQEGLYYPDGQVLEEVYVTGSFLQSRMHQNHVSCTNCHEPHSSQLRIEGNGLCLQCHEAPIFQSEQHFFHPPDSAGAQCVNCHMPQTTYMGVDARRDHSFRVPDPLASVELGVPNACTACHSDKNDEWAAEFMREHSDRDALYYPHAPVLDAARNNDTGAAPELLALATDASQPALLRATALLESASFPSQQQLRAVLAGLDSDEPLLRMNAAMALGALEPEVRFSYLEELLDDPVKSVRLAVARQLGGLAPAQVPANLRSRFEQVLAEYEESLRFNADMPEAMNELGVFQLQRGEVSAAESSLTRARTLAPGYLPTLLNLSEVYRVRNREELGLEVLQDAVARYPDSGDAAHALGLLYVRTGRTAESVALFQRASELMPGNPRYVLVYAVSLAETGRIRDAVSVLEDAVRRFPENAQLRNVLQAYRSAQ